MDRSQLIGFALIFVIIFTLMKINEPSQAEMDAEKRAQDSIAQITNPITPSNTTSDITKHDSLTTSSDTNAITTVAPATETIYTLENALIKIEFSSIGGIIKRAQLKQHNKVSITKDRKEIKSDLFLLEDDKNKFEFLIPGNTGIISSKQLNFAGQVNGNVLQFNAQLPDGSIFTQSYTLEADNYALQYNIKAPNATGPVKIQWENYLDKLEWNASYEQYISTIYFKELEEQTDYCDCREDDQKNPSKRVSWVSHSNQFFNSTLINTKGFERTSFHTGMLNPADSDLKKLSSTMEIPAGEINQGLALQWYIGPNEYKRLSAYNQNVEDIIPYGWSIFGTVNRWIIRPMFNFLSGLFGSKGLIILLLTLVVKLFLFPLTYKMLASQAKMTALKPELDKMRAKYKDDMSTQQTESMKIYQEFGVNPLGGCMPLLLQMPIWFALYRFFPASIEFRQESFLWATDLSSYDAFAYLPFAIPFYGDHVSLFTLLWVITTIIYTYYSSKSMDFSANPAMLYMQYIMPFFFLFFFNTTAAGLTCYMLFSNILNIAQTLGARKFLFDENKIKAELQAYKIKPKTAKTGFAGRMEAIMKESQRLQQERQKNKK